MIGRRDAYDRVIASVLERYLLEDSTFARRATRHHVPRFLLNDFARYWRTMAVDFAYKARSREGAGMGLRNFKLRMSRKLIYVAGLLTCFSCDLGIAAGSHNGGCPKNPAECIDCLRRFMRRPPLEIVADVLLALSPQTDATARKIMGAYDKFVGVLDDGARREKLAALRAEDLESDAFKEPREISHEFRDGVLEMFFDDNRLSKLTRIYGVF